MLRLGPRDRQIDRELPVGQPAPPVEDGTPIAINTQDPPITGGPTRGGNAQRTGTPR